MTLVDGYYPFDTGPGSNATQARWRVMSRSFAPSGVVPGYLNAMAPTIAGSVVSINTGGAWIDGFYGEITTTAKTVTVTGAGMVVACADPTAHNVEIFFRPGQNTPTQPTNGQGIYEIPLAQITGTTTFTLTDIRQYTYGISMPLARAYAAAQTVLNADARWFQIGLGLAFARQGMAMSGSAIQVPVTGIYRVSAQIFYMSSNNTIPGGRYVLSVGTNGTAGNVLQTETWTTAASFPDPHGTTLISLNAHDTVGLWGYKTNGNVNVGTYVDGRLTYMDLEMVSR